MSLKRKMKREQLKRQYEALKPEFRKQKVRALDAHPDDAGKFRRPTFAQFTEQLRKMPETIKLQQDELQRKIEIEEKGYDLEWDE